MASFEKLTKRFGAAGTAHVEVGRTTRHHRTGNIFRAEIQMHFPKKEMRAEAMGKTIFEAMDKVKDDVYMELERYKEKDIDLQKRGARKLKRMMKGV